MLENIRPEDVLFIDIETVPACPSFEEMKPEMKTLWEKKSLQIKNEGNSSEELYNRAGIYAEFGKIICISAGFISERNPFRFRLKSFYGDREKDVLEGFSGLLSKTSRGRDITLCAHNGKEFDYPYIARRMIINRLPIPSLLDNAGRKPWEIKLLDTMELWKFGDYKSYTSLALLTTALGIPSPKDDIDGSMVADTYWKERQLERIVRYCEKDVLAVAQVFLRFMNLETIPEDRIESVTLFD